MNKIWKLFDGIAPGDALPCLIDSSVPMVEGSSFLPTGKMPCEIVDGVARPIHNWTLFHSTTADTKRWARDPRHGIILVHRQLKGVYVEFPDTSTGYLALSDFESYMANAYGCVKTKNSRLWLVEDIYGMLEKTFARYHVGGDNQLNIEIRTANQCSVIVAPGKEFVDEGRGIALPRRLAAALQDQVTNYDILA